MPLEIKKIFFTDNEIKQSLVNYSVSRKQPLEYRDINKMVVTNSNDVQISLLVHQALEIEGNKINYTKHEVAAALITFCLAINIPLARAAIKELHTVNDSVYLKITHQQDANFAANKTCTSSQNTDLMRA